MLSLQLMSHNMKFISHAGRKRRHRRCRGKRLQGCTREFSTHFINGLFFWPCYILISLITILVSICSQGDPGNSYYRGAKGDKGQEGPEVRYYLTVISLTLTFQALCLCAHSKCSGVPKEDYAILLHSCTISFSLQERCFTTSLWHH